MTTITRKVDLQMPKLLNSSWGTSNFRYLNTLHSANNFNKYIPVRSHFFSFVQSFHESRSSKTIFESSKFVHK